MSEPAENTPVETGRRLQFSLPKLLWFIAAIALSLATFGPWGIAITLFLLAQALWFRGPTDRVGLIAAWGLLFLLGACVVHGHRESARISQCTNNLKSIGLALHSYHDHYGQLPPQYLADAEGRPMHSWRVLILPYLQDADAAAVYQRYRFDEPWDGPNNRKLAGQASGCFRCSTANEAEPDSPFATHYVAVAGPGTAWSGATGRRLKEILDGTLNTVLIVEIAGSDIHWMEPRDVSLDEALDGQDGAHALPSSHHHVERTYFFSATYPLAGNVLLADGSCRRFCSQPSRGDLEALLSIDGGERIVMDALAGWPRGVAPPWLDVRRCLSYAFFVVFLALLVW